MFFLASLWVERLVVLALSHTLSARWQVCEQCELWVGVKYPQLPEKACVAAEPC